MPKQHVVALDYIRGLSMLGVLGIHTGAYSLSYPAVNEHLFALLEIFTRFSVPIFFFVSAFGLFISQPLSKPFCYQAFMRRRLKAVLLPYLAWSLLYMLHYSLTNANVNIWNWPLICEYLLFGLASYQLYFLVILVWFYAFMPLWRYLASWIIKMPIISLFSLLLGQIAFNYYSSYMLAAGFGNYYLDLAIQHRMSYWLLHYLFIFILGAVCAELYPQLLAALERNKRRVNSFFAVALAGMLSYYYYLIYFRQYSLEQAVNTAHQLSPIGVLYTLAATFFWFSVFSRPLPVRLTAVLGRLGDYSYLIYLIHPLVMYYLTLQLSEANIALTPFVTTAFYFITLMLSCCLAEIIKRLGSLTPLVCLALTGSFPKQGTVNRKG